MNQRDAFQSAHGVPRGTMAAFDSYAALLNEWQLRMNLVGPSTLPAIWDRHFSDSAQLLGLTSHGRSWLDIGAGAGFPGLVVALLDPEARIVLVESITKKCRFLEEAVTVLGISGRVKIENCRIEALSRQKFDVVTARALASLEQLFHWALPYAGSGTLWLLPKGVRVEEELAIAIDRFAFDYNLVPSRTDDSARIVVASGVKCR
jgi:16S rRNA (guanine527-N7)-methyltransferase